MTRKNPLKNRDRIEELIADTLKRIDKLDELIIETRELANATKEEAKAATIEAKAATEQAKTAANQALDSRYLLEKHIAWHDKPSWKKWFGIQ